MRTRQPITTSMFASFVGGQLEIQNGLEGYLYRGQIKSVEVDETKPDDPKIKVKFAWCAKNDGTPDRPSPEWTADSRLDYAVSTQIYQINEMDDLGRIIMHSQIIGETSVFFPAGYTNRDGEKRQLDRNRVKGLN